MQASLHLCNVCPQHKGYCTCAAFSTYAQHVHYPNLNSKATGFTLFTDRWRVDSSQWTKGRSLNMTSHFFVPLMVPLQSVVPLGSLVINVNVQILNSKPTDFTLSTDRFTIASDEGAELKHGVTCLRSRTIENSLMFVRWAAISLPGFTSR